MLELVQNVLNDINKTFLEKCLAFKYISNIFSSEAFISVILARGKLQSINRFVT